MRALRVAQAEIRQGRSGDLADLHCFYEQTDGPSHGFLKALAKQSTTLFWLAADDAGALAVAWFTHIGSEAELVDVRVREDARGRGLGTRLLERALTDLAALGTQQCRLEVRQSNAPAQALYRSLKFQAVGVREAYYGGPEGREDALLMLRAHPLPEDLK